MTGFQGKVQNDKLLTGITAGLVAGLIATLTDIIPMAAFVFSGSLEPYVATGIGINLFSSAVVGLVIALRSSFTGIIAFPVAEEMATLAVILSAVARQIPSSASAEEVILTIIGAIALTSLLVGIFLLVVGQLKLGELIRFLPYPVVGGFLAGLGCLLSLGGLQVMADVGTVAQLPLLFQPQLLLKWIPGAAFAFALLALTHRYKHILLIPLSFVSVTGLFYLVLSLTQTSMATAFDQRWLLGPFPTGQLWKPMSLLNLTQVNWTLILTQLPGMFALMLITALSILLVSSGLELVMAEDLDLNQELKAAGVANILSGLLGGIVGSHTIGATILARQIGGKSRLTSVVVSGFYLVVLLAGLSLLSYFPRFVAGGALLFIGIPLIVSWVYDGWFKLSRIDYAVMLLITAVVTLIGFMEGVVVGLVVAIALFVLKYSQINVARYTLAGSSYSSRIRRSPNQERLLRQEGSQIQILQLQGFIFFGTAHTLLKQIRELCLQGRAPMLKPEGDAESHAEGDPELGIRFLVLDFRLVSGLDSSAMLSLLKLKPLAQQRSLTLVLTSLSPTILAQFQREGLLSEPYCQVFPTLDEGIAWCESQILENSQFRRRRTLPLALQLEVFFQKSQDEIPAFLQYLEEINLEAGEYLFRQSEQSDGLYFLEYGEVSTQRGVENQPEPQHFETLGAGTLVGETDFYARCLHRVSAIANQPSTLYRLSAAALQKMQQEHPLLAGQFNEFMNRLFSERLVQAQTEIEILLK
ncbi:MAG TPA: SulP family inorganic anion transporter [Coleofasciculaceae cyanobacterium]|jgi:SulP family sulfate permease